jgi:hypothetical protein
MAGSGTMARQVAATVTGSADLGVGPYVIACPRQLSSQFLHVSVGFSAEKISDAKYVACIDFPSPRIENELNATDERRRQTGSLPKFFEKLELLEGARVPDFHWPFCPGLGARARSLEHAC